MHQQGTNIVNGGVSGNNNQFSNHNYIQNNNGGGNHKGGGGDPLTIGLGALAIMIVTAVAFLRHFEQVYFWLQIGAVTGAALSLLAWLAFIRDDDFLWSRTWPTLFGVATGCAALLVSGEGYNAITPEMLQAASLPGHPFEVWGRFRPYGHRLIGENMATVACLSGAIALNILMGLHTLFGTLARTEQNAWLATLANFIQPFRAKRGGIFAAFLVGVAYLAVSGVWFDLFARAQ